VRTAARVALLVGLWLLAWGDVSLANLLSGVAVAVAVLLAFPPQRLGPGARLHPLGVARLGAYVAVQLVVSNALMARQILRRQPDVRPGVVAHRLRSPSDEAITVMTSIIALSPGTMTVDVDRASTTVYVHFFRLGDLAEARTALDRLDRLVTGAIQTDDRSPQPEVP
jgi:multicomponent Na+:H+ antiporter subunit E